MQLTRLTRRLLILQHSLLLKMKRVTTHILTRLLSQKMALEYPSQLGLTGI